MDVAKLIRPGLRLYRSRLAGLALVLLTGIVLSACREADDLARLVPRVIAPGSAPHVLPAGSLPPIQTSLELPPRLPTEGFDFDLMGADPAGQLQYRVRILQDGHPYQVATTKLTPLFSVNGKTSATYVSEAYFRSNPQRTPFTIQPGDEFVLTLPRDTFVVRWQEDHDEELGQPALVRTYVSEQGDWLRFYLTDEFPIRYEMVSHNQPGIASVQLHPELNYLLENRLTTPMKLAQLIYRVPDPDFFQMEATSRLIASVRSGANTMIEVDRTKTHLDPIRDYWTAAFRYESVAEPARAQLRRAIFLPDQQVPYIAIEDAIPVGGTISSLVNGTVFRIEYARDGTVTVYYKTGADDARGKRDPFALRESGRWSDLYQRLSGVPDAPVKWGPGEASDVETFPSSRDPSYRTGDPQKAFDYQIPGRAVRYTFRPVRSLSAVRAELEFNDLLHDLRDKYRGQIESAMSYFEKHQKETDLRR